MNRSASELSQLPISELRTIAAGYGLPLKRDMAVAQIAAMIAGHESGPVINTTEAMGERPNPGYARIEIQRDTNPGASNAALFFGVNGYQVQIQRGKKVDVPIKILKGAIEGAEVEVLREDTTQTDLEKRYTFEKMPALPYTVYDINPGPDPRDDYEKAAKSRNRNKRAFRSEFGYWPKPAELKEWLAFKDLANRGAAAREK